MTLDLIPHIDRMIRRRPAMKGILEAYRELVHIMNEVGPASVRIETRSNSANERENGSPLFSRKDLPVDPDHASETLSRFFERFSRSERRDKHALRAAWQVSRQSPGWSKMILRAALAGDETALGRAAEQVGLEPKALEFFGLSALGPSLTALREEFHRRVNTRTWSRGCCPLCGSQPDMAHLDKSGKRRLYCGLCGTEWSYPRMKCPFCCNTESETLGYFVDEESEALRVDFCDKCTRYIKTVDAGLLEELAPMEVERLGGIHLDFVAHEHGYT